MDCGIGLRPCAETSAAASSQAAGATATFAFTGTQVSLNMVRDVDQGIMTVSVDGGTPQSVDNYAATRNASGVVWTSPVLTEGSHTLTIVNTGQKNAESSGINIAIDRADVTSRPSPDSDPCGADPNRS